MFVNDLAEREGAAYCLQEPEECRAKAREQICHSRAIIALPYNWNGDRDALQVEFEAHQHILEV